MIINYANGFEYVIVEINDNIVNFLKSKNIYIQYMGYLMKHYKKGIDRHILFTPINNFNSAFFFSDTSEGSYYWIKLSAEFKNQFKINKFQKIRGWLKC